MTYIILYKDFSMSVAGMKPHPEYYQKGARFFEAKDTLTIQDMSECYFFQWRTINFTERLGKLIKEIS